eukprot:2867035-Rhodomonas_salina.1
MATSFMTGSDGSAPACFLPGFAVFASFSHHRGSCALSSDGWLDCSEETELLRASENTMLTSPVSASSSSLLGASCSLSDALSSSEAELSCSEKGGLEMIGALTPDLICQLYAVRDDAGSDVDVSGFADPASRASSTAASAAAACVLLPVCRADGSG